MKQYHAIGLIAALLALITGCNAPAKQEQGKSFKNVVILVGDDHAPDVLGVAGNDLVRTPNLDRLANRGIYFTHAYANSPICSASRQSMITGKYPFSTGVTLLFTPFPDDGNVTIGEHLRQQGYRTALIGKNHFNDWVWGGAYEEGAPDHGFDLMVEGAEYRQFLEEHPMPELPKDMITYPHQVSPRPTANRKNAGNLPAPCFDEYCKNTFYAQRAVEFIENSDAQPFCLWVGFNQAHSPFTYPIEYANKYEAEDMPLPQLTAEDTLFLPLQFADLTEEERKGIVAAYYTSVEFLDKNVGIILNALETNNLMDETVVVYVGDHGYLLNEHGRFEKHMFWEEAVKSPLIVWPGAGDYDYGTTDALAEFVDIVPTVYELAGAPSQPEVEGESLVPVLVNRNTSVRDTVFSVYYPDNKAMLATQEWKYIFSSGISDYKLDYATGRPPMGMMHRLYDLKDDANETKNLAGYQKYSELLDKFKQAMLQRFMTYHHDANRVPSGLNLEGKLSWFLFPRDIGAEPGASPLRLFDSPYDDR